jgi:hypothetical protein
MRSLARFALLLLFLPPLPVFAAPDEPKSDAARFDFAGPIKSVSTTSARTDVVWSQPSGPTMIEPIYCSECELDRDGNTTKSGQLFNGSFQGENIILTKDTGGHVIERLFENAQTKAPFRREVLGPFGKTDEYLYQGDQVQSASHYSYDQYGHLIDVLTLDPAGTQTARMLMNIDKDGNNKEEWDWGKPSEFRLHFVQTLDPKTHIETFTSFNEYGSAKLSWTFVAEKLRSYWQAPGEPPQFGDGFIEGLETDTPETYQCHSSGVCDFARVHYDYPDGKRRNPRSVEWRDAEGHLQFATYFEYELDTFGNWTQRSVWVWSTELADRKLYETDTRTLTYWPR